MKFVLSIIIIFLLILLQSSLYPYLKIYNAFPNLILILTLILSILGGYKKSLIWVIFGGLLLDIYSFNNPIGISILGLFLISYLAYFFRQNIFKKADILLMISVGVGGTLIYGLFLMSALLIVGVNFRFTITQLISQIIYNLIIFIPLFFLIKKFKHA